MFARLQPVLLIAAVANLVIGMLAGLGRLGYAVPVPESIAHHGAVMVGGFLGTLIALEKIIPLKRPALFVGPLLSASSVIAFTNGGIQTAVGMQVAAGLIFLAAYVFYLRVQSSLPLWLATAGVLFWVVGTGWLFASQFYPMVFPWYMAFLLFTIVSERLELSRFLPVTSRNRAWLIAFLGIFFLGLIVPFHGVGKYLCGAALVLTSLWLLRFDVIRITLQKEGLMRFTAVALLCGYFMLLLEGLFLIFLGNAALGYDMTLHTFFLGFVFSMIFAHGPIILPGVLGLSVKPYSTLFYFPLILLVASLVLRLLADVFLIPISLRGISGWLSAGAILLYFVLMIVSTASAVSQARRV